MNTLRDEQNIINQYGKSLNFDAAVNLMDDDLREQLHIKCWVFQAWIKDYQDCIEAGNQSRAKLGKSSIKIEQCDCLN